MKCYDCGGEFIEKSGTLELHDKRIGNYQVANVQYYKCNKCGELLFRGATVRIIEAKESEILNKLITKLSLKDFIGATEAAQILGISRQAIHKHRRIRRGFIYSTDFEGRKVYHRKSVELFKDSGDGRFILTKEPEAPEVKYVFVGNLGFQKKTKYQEIGGEKELHVWFESIFDENLLGQGNG